MKLTKIEKGAHAFWMARPRILDAVVLTDIGERGPAGGAWLSGGRGSLVDGDSVEWLGEAGVACVRGESLARPAEWRCR